MPICRGLRTLCLVTAVLCNVVQPSLEREIPRRSFLSRRAIDGTRGRKYFDPNEEGAFDSYGSAGGQYDPYDHATDLSDIRRNVPGEPGVDYPAYTTLPQTGFTCEGRSRGYYADEAAGCQVFHVCHDVLVSSFLCPIGSTFSQKLLTCDWWTKVDCSTTSRYLGVNRDTYQIDDDEMIRNAYAMISLQSAEDVTRDGLVDPDSGARIIDYAALSGRTAGYTPGFRRITDYPAVDATGNDLPSGFDDYDPRNDPRSRGLNYDDRYQQKAGGPEDAAAYRGKFRLESKDRSPYHAAPIIRPDDYSRQRSADNEDFREGEEVYRRPDGFTDRLQASYAPTVPTVTTTTRRLYSPTVPTTYRPSTLAYSKLDLLVDSSDHLYAHSKSLGSLATPPTIVRRNHETGGAGEETRDDPEKSASVSSSRTDADDGRDIGARGNDDEVRLVGEKAETSFRINVTDAIDEEDEEVFRRQNDRPVIRDDSGESSQDIETKDSIGIARALNDPSGGIVARDQEPPAEKVPRDGRAGWSKPDRSSGSFYDEANSTRRVPEKRPSDFATDDDDDGTSDDRSTEDHEDIANSTTTTTTTTTTTENLEETAYTRSYDDVALASTVSVTATPATSAIDRGESIDRPSFNDSDRTTVDQSSSSTRSVSSFDDESSRVHLVFGIPQPVRFLQPPSSEGFLINVPNEKERTRYATFNGASGTTTTTTTTTTTETLPRFSDAIAAEDEDRNESSALRDGNERLSPIDDYADYYEGLLSETPDPRDRFAGFSTLVPSWLVSSWRDRSAAVSAPATDIVPPIVDYNDGFDDFLPPARDAARSQDAFPTTTSRNDSESEPPSQRYNAGLQFTIRDAVRIQLESQLSSRSPCHSAIFGRHARPCGIAPEEVPAFTPGVLEKEKTPISIGSGEATAEKPEQPIAPGNAGPPEKPVISVVPNEPSVSTARSSNAISVDTERSVPTRTVVTPKYASSRDDISSERRAEEETTEATTASGLPRGSTRPDSSRQLEEDSIDRRNSPHEVSPTVRRHEEDPTTIPDDFVGRLIGRHQRPTSSSVVPKEQPDDFEIVRSIEDEIAPFLRPPKFPDTSRASSSGVNGSFALNDTEDRAKGSDSNISMLSLVQLMAELLKLDRLPRPFSTKDLRNVELETSLSLDLDEPPSFVTAGPLFDHSQAGTPFGSFVNYEAAALDTSTSKPATSMNLHRSSEEPSFVTATSLSDRARATTTSSERATNFRRTAFEDAPRTSSPDVALKSTDVASTANPERVITKLKASRSESATTTRPLRKHEILEQLAENFGQPLYRGDAIHRSLVLDLPQVQRSLDFETGLSIEESERATGEAEVEDSAPSTTTMTTTTSTTTTTTMQESTTTTTTTTEKTIVETEFVPSIGFSFDTNEDREEYVEAILGGLIDDHGRDGGKKNETSIAQSAHVIRKNETSRPDVHEGPKDVEK